MDFDILTVEEILGSDVRRSGQWTTLTHRPERECVAYLLLHTTVSASSN